MKMMQKRKKNWGMIMKMDDGMKSYEKLIVSATKASSGPTKKAKKKSQPLYISFFRYEFT